MKFDSAPIKKPFIGDSIINGKVWIQWLTTLGDALKGEWSEGSRSLVVSEGFETENYCSFQGRNVFVRVTFEETNISGTIQILDSSGKPILFEDGLLNLYDDLSLVTGVEVIGTDIKLPTLAVSGNQVLTGTLGAKEVNNGSFNDCNFRWGRYFSTGATMAELILQAEWYASFSKSTSRCTTKELLTSRDKLMVM